MSRSLMAGVISALMTSQALTAELPLFGAYGDLESCTLWKAKVAPPQMNTSTIVTRDGVFGMEYGCEFKVVTPDGPSSWKATASCGGEGEEWTTTYSIKVSPDRKTAEMTNDRRGSQSLRLPSCVLMPYTERLRLELQRFPNH